MITIPIEKSLGTMLFDSSFPKNDFETREQKKNADGIPQWSVSVILRQPDARRSEIMSLTVASSTDPADAFQPLQPIVAQNLRIMTGENSEGRTWVSFGADKLSALPTASNAPKAAVK